MHVLVLAAGCRESAPAPSAELPPLVRVAQVERVSAERWGLSGTIRAREEMPVAFRIGGQIRRRLVDAGSRVRAGQVLFELDDQDAQQGVAAAEAQVAAARAEAEHAERERLRAATLREQRIVSEQGYELATTAATAARERLRAAEAQLAQARNMLEYTKLVAARAGIVAEVHAEAGQVVAPGQVVAVVAVDGPREVEVYLPETRHASPPSQATAFVWGDAREWPARLREVAGSADPVARTWRARFALEGDTQELPLGVTVRLVFAENETLLQRIPASALFDKGDGPHVWVVRDGRVELRSVNVRALEGEYALIDDALPPDAAIVALGVHLLEPGQAVRMAP